MKCCGVFNVLIALFVVTQLNAQLKVDPTFFSYPLEIKPKLNANFGEMRPNHFHMGLDLSTDSRENLPVYAPADGYIARIKIEQGGFGRAIYLNHPNGLTTLYAHMNRFIPEAELYLKARQYDSSTWAIDLNISEKVIPIKKGQLIGYSGNTGASQGPHVHFEIRDTKTENCYNPLRFKFPIVDYVAPSILKLAFYNRAKSIYEQVPKIVSLVKVGNSYKVPGLISLPFSDVFIGLFAIDRMNGVSNQYGVFKTELFHEDELISSFEMEDIGYDKTRYLNGHIDFTTRSKGGSYFQMLFPPINYGLRLYKPKAVPFSLAINKTPAAYMLKVYDAFGNTSTATFQLQGSALKQTETVVEGQKMIPGNVNIVEDDMVRFVFNEDAFYDSFSFSYTTVDAKGEDLISLTYKVANEHIPVHSYYTVSIKPNKNNAVIDPNKVLVRRTRQGKIEVKKAILEKDFYTARVRELGTFQLLEDRIPPVISSNIYSGQRLSGSSRITIDITDNNKTIKDFKATLDGQWLLFQPVGNRFFYYPDEHFSIGEHKLSIVVYDEVGNMSTKEWILSR
jgi:murein DD-endopeptidase MepM/ murein hydrolase activator NlpD